MKSPQLTQHMTSANLAQVSGGSSDGASGGSLRLASILYVFQVVLSYVMLEYMSITSEQPL